MAESAPKSGLADRLRDGARYLDLGNRGDHGIDCTGGGDVGIRTFLVSIRRFQRSGIAR